MINTEIDIDARVVPNPAAFQAGVSLLQFIIRHLFPSKTAADAISSYSASTVPDLLSKSKEEILSFLGGIYHYGHSSWLAENFYSKYIEAEETQINTARDLFQAMSSIFNESSREQKLELLNAYPDLCAKIEQLSKLSKESQAEQSSAWLETLTPEERDRFTKNNTDYCQKFGFPFILAARNVTKYTGVLCPFPSKTAADAISSSSAPTVPDLLSKSKEEILSFLGGIYYAPWVGENFYSKYIEEAEETQINTARDLFQAMSSIVNESSREQKLELLNAYPDLCAKIEQLSKLSKESQAEQSSAGLETLTPEERDRFTKLNTDYCQKFGFSFILAAKNVTKYTVLSAIEGRIEMSYDTEFIGALYQVNKIAWMRLLAAFRITGQKGFLTCHVLDTANGCPAANMKIQLHRIKPVEKAGFIQEFKTNSDGRLPNGPALQEENFLVGTYEWTFFVGDYFARFNTKTSGVPFLDEVPLRFGIDDPEEHYHVPLLVSPLSYSTYRGGS